MLSVGCQSKKVNEPITPNVISLDFPVYPITDWIKDNRDGTCTVPSQWIIDLAEFEILYEKVIADYNFYIDKEETIVK